MVFKPKDDSGVASSIGTTLAKLRKLARGGNARAIKLLAELEAKRKRSKSSGGTIPVRDLSEGEITCIINDGVVTEIDLALTARRTNVSSPTAITSGVRGAAFDEAKHVRSGQGKFSNKLNPSELIAARRVIEGQITNLAVGQSYTLPDRLGYVKRTPGGYFVQGSGGYTASVRTLSAAIQAAAVLLAGKVQVTR